MTRRLMLRTSFGTVLALAFAAAPLAAHPGHDHKVLGTVVSIAANRLVVKDRENKEVTITLNADTKVLKARQPATLDDVKPGARVVVTAATERNVTIGKLIDLGVPRPTK
jgi:hypothetical protein